MRWLQQYGLFWIIYGVALAVLVLFLATFAPGVDLLARPLKVTNQLQQADVIVAYSAGLIKDCQPQIELIDRELAASVLLKQGYSRSNQMIITGKYTDEKQHSLPVCQKLMATRLGIRPEQLIIDNTAKTTHDNTLHTLGLMRMNGWHQALLVTSASHMRRALWSFQKESGQKEAGQKETELLSSNSRETYRAFPFSIPDQPDPGTDWFNWNRVAHLHRLLYEYGAIFEYKCYGYL